MNTPPTPVLRIQDLAAQDRPQERLDRLGPAALSDAELLALVLRSGGRGCNVISLAQQLLGAAGSLAALVSWTPVDFRRVKGIGPVKALQLVATLEIARRVLAGAPDAAPLLNTPELVQEHCASLIKGLEVEKFWVLCLNRKNRLLKLVEVTSGTATSSLAHPREVFREAIRQGATAVICVHNHPSGDPAPSSADVSITRQLREAAKAVDIALHDHCILGHRTADPRGLGYYSFRLAGLL